MDENFTNDKMMNNKNNRIKIIRISKEFNQKGKEPENIMLVNIGKHKVQYTLNYKISEDNILRSLKTIQSNPIYNENYKLYSSHGTKKKNKEQNLYDKKKSDIFKKFSLKDSKRKNDEEKSNKDIYNLKINVKKIDLIKKKTYNTKLIKEDSESNRSLKNEGKSSNLNSELNFQMDKTSFFGDKKYNTIFRRRSNKNLVYNFINLKKVMTINNIDRNNINIVESNISKISNLAYTKSNKFLYEKENNNIDDSENLKFEKNCYICEKYFVFPSLFFPNCKIHFFCKNCLKIYCHDLIMKGIRNIKCPIYNCKYEFDEIFLRKIVDEDCYNKLFLNEMEEENADKNTKKVNISKPLILIDKDNQEKIEMYNKENVLDVNTNSTLYSVRKSKDEYCPNCHEHSLFIKANTFFYKCLNCGHKICKYCNKEFTNIHFSIDDPNHCKVYFRRKKHFSRKNIFFKFIFQLIYTIGMFIISFFFFFWLIKNFFKLVLGIGKRSKNWLKIFFLYFLSCCICLIVLPFLVVFIPFFPNIVVLTDGY